MSELIRTTDVLGRVFRKVQLDNKLRREVGYKTNLTDAIRRLIDGKPIYGGYLDEASITPEELISLRNWIDVASSRVRRGGSNIEDDESASQEFFPAGIEGLARIKYLRTEKYKSVVGHEANTSLDFLDIYSESAIPEHDIYLRFTPITYFFDISYIDRSDNTYWQYTLERPMADMRNEDYMIAKFCLVDFVREMDPII